MVRCLRGRGSGRGRGRGREGGAGSACGVRQQRVEGERASWQGGLWGWQWVGAAVVAEVGEEVEAVVAREWKQGLARGSGEGGGPVNWTWCCCYLHAALSTGAAELLSSRRSAHLRRIGVGGARARRAHLRVIERPWVRERQLQWILLRMMVRRYRVLCRSGEAGTSSRTSLPGIS